jgi:hypothetical protein
VLYIIPHGRVTYWTFWRLLGLQKQDWEALHTIFGFLMVLLGIWHIFLNWKSLKNYFLRKKTVVFSKEFWIAGGITFAIAVLILLNVPPFSTIIELEESIKTSWEKKVPTPPVPHMELFSLSRVAKFLNVPETKLAEILKGAGIKVSSFKETLKEVAEKNHSSPAQIYNLILKNLKLKTSLQTGAGWGKKSLKEVCKEIKVPVSECISFLKQKGISARPESSLKDLAFSAGYTPYELVEELKKLAK